jgi:DNA helicase HerA-like ATPase
VYGYLPPHPQNPPTKRRLVALMKQARAFGVGVVLATQNPMDLDYRALSNAGLWCVGRLQTDAERERVIEGLGAAGEADGPTKAELANIVKKL